MPRRVMRSCAAFLLHTACLLWLTWPLALRLGTHGPLAPWPGTEIDAPLIAWALAHESRALVSDLAALPHGNAFHPAPYALAHGEPAYGALPFFMPVFLATENPTLALNVTLLLPLVLTALGLHVVVRRWTGSSAAGVIAGWSFLSARWVLHAWVPSAPNYAVLCFLPWIIYLAAEREPPVARRLVLLVLVVLQGLASPYVGAATLAPLGVLAAGRVLRPRHRIAGLTLGVVVAIAAMALALVYGGTIRQFASDPTFRERTVWRLAAPWFLPVPQAWGRTGAPTNIGAGAVALIGLGLAVRAVGWGAPGAGLRAAWLHGSLWTLVGLLLMLPRTILVGGVAIPGPWRWLAMLPAGDAIRVPGRLGIAALLGLCVLAGASFRDLRHAIGRLFGARLSGQRAGAVMAAVLFATVGATAIWLPWSGRPYRLKSRSIDVTSPIAQALAAPGGAVLELPTTSPGAHAQAMFRSIAHRRRLVNGYNGYWPAGFAERMALACELPHPAALRQLVAETGLDLILVHQRGWPTRPGTPPYGCPAGTAAHRGWARWMHVARVGHPALVLVARMPHALLFRVRPVSPGP